MVTDDELLRKYAEQVQRFRVFCVSLTPKTNDAAFDDTDFYDFSLGYFVALGVVEDSSGEGEPFLDAHSLARICRYRFQYWTLASR